MLLPGTTRPLSNGTVQDVLKDTSLIAARKLRGCKAMSDSLLSSLQNFLTCGARSRGKSFRSTYNEQFHESVRSHWPLLFSRSVIEADTSAQKMTSSSPPPYEFRDSLPVRETGGEDQTEAHASGRSGADVELKDNKDYTRTGGRGMWQYPSSVL